MSGSLALPAPAWRVLYNGADITQRLATFLVEITYEEAVGKRLLTAAMSASVDLYMKAIKEFQEEEARQANVRRKERQNREEREGPVDVSALVAPLPPPAGYPGGPPYPKKDKKP